MANDATEKVSLSIYLLGSFTLFYNQETRPLPASVSAQSLLAYLGLNRQHSFSRTHLVGILWPNLPEARERRLLSQALWQLRQSLPHPDRLLEVSGETIYVPLQQTIWIDTEQFHFYIRLCGAAYF